MLNTKFKKTNPRKLFPDSTLRKSLSRVRVVPIVSMVRSLPFVLRITGLRIMRIGTEEAKIQIVRDLEIADRFIVCDFALRKHNTDDSVCMAT